MSLREFQRRLAAADLGETAEAAHVQLALDFITTTRVRQSQLQSGKIKPLPGPSEAAADKLYTDTALKLCNGLDAVLKAYATSPDPARQKVYRAWQGSTR